MNKAEVRSFAIGLLIGSIVILLPFYFYNKQQIKLTLESHQKIFDRHRELDEANQETYSLYNETLSNSLYDEVKLLCMVMTHPGNHRTKALHVKTTWGRRCNKLLFMSSKADLALDTVVLPIEETRENLWKKTKAGFKYLHDNYLNDYDFFLKADDDNFMIVENIRYMLAHYKPTTALYFGHRYSSILEEGYMAGGGYILSRKALKKFAEKIVFNPTICHESSFAEDVEMGRCLAHSALFVDCRDEKHQKRFFPVGVEEHMKRTVDPNYWYTKSQYYHVPQGNISCCSETSAEFHYINPHEMYLIDYFVYNLHPFGVDTHPEETLPQKFTMDEIIKQSDIASSSKNFRKHKNYHNFEPSEIK